MKKKLLFLPSSIGSFTNDETGEVIKGASIYLAEVDPVHDSSYHGVYVDKIWINEDIYSRLVKDSRVSTIPCTVDVSLENRGLKGKPRITNIEYVD